MRRVSMAARDELVAAIAGRYARGSRAERGRILDEFAAVTGFHRKHAMRLLRAGQPSRPSGRRPWRRVYDDAVREALIVVWEASDRVCGKRLRPLVPILLERRLWPRMDRRVADETVICTRLRTGRRLAHATSSSSLLASFRSAVSKPSVYHP